MNSGGTRQRFVFGGGWIRQERSTKPKTVFFGALAAAWFIGCAIEFSNTSDVTMAFWKVAGLGQLAFLLAAMITSFLEQPITKTRLVRNPDQKPVCLY